MRKLLFVPWNHPEVSELQLKELDIPEGGECFQVCWTPCFPAKWLASSGRIKNVSTKPPTRSKDRMFVQCSKCRFVVLSLNTLHSWPPFPHLIFTPAHPRALWGVLCCSGPDHLSHSAITSLHCSTKPLRLLRLAKLKIKIKSVVISNLSSPYHERNWMQGFENPRKITRIKEFPLHWMGPFPILNFSVWVESPAEWDMSRGHQTMSELPAQFLKHICAEVAACAALWPHALSDFCWRHNQANLLPELGTFTLSIYRYFQVASWRTLKANLGCQNSHFLLPPDAGWEQQSPTPHSCQQSHGIQNY